MLEDMLKKLDEELDESISKLKYSGIRIIYSPLMKDDEICFLVGKNIKDRLDKMAEEKKE
jgi:hypothetical protein